MTREAGHMDHPRSGPFHGTPRPGHAAGPAREGAVARALRWAEDRRRLAELDGRLLRDVGLTRGDVALGTPFAAPRAGRDRTRGRAGPAPGARLAERRA